MSEVSAQSARLSTDTSAFRRHDGRPVEWRVADTHVPYAAAVADMERRVAAITDGDAAEQVWLLEHPPLYTAGTSMRETPPDSGLPLYRTGRGGQMTYHGPGQRIAYVMLDLQARRPDVRAFVSALEAWIIETLGAFAIRGERREDRVGVWVARPEKAPGIDGTQAEDKIAAIGIRVRRWVTFHGVSLNVEPELAHYAGIVPCGIAERHFGVTSLIDLGLSVSMADVDLALRGAFERVFGPTIDASA